MNPKTLLQLFLMIILLFPNASIYAEQSTGEYLIGPGDVISIQVWDHADLNRKVEVSQEGDFTFPLIGKVHTAGLSVFELEKIVTDKLGSGYLISPQITITIEEFKNQEVFLFGAVKQPGSYVVKGKTHILKLTTDAGGFVDESGMSATIIRPKSPLLKNKPLALDQAKENELITIDLNQVTVSSTEDKFYIYPGDSIYINKMARFFVTGEVQKPGIYNWEKDLTIREAISIAGGATQRGSEDRAWIVRRQDNTETRLTPELSDTVMPNDIITVPKSYF
ncbi:MAG: polysaccharide biosynthesis/export family protein [Pseudomonadota bacterium]